MNAQTLYHPAASRGHANHGWLNSYHTFSFANYFNPDRIHFGALRVLNDDTVSGGMGFGTHPHANMEIISIPLEGDLAHKDSMGNEEIIRAGDVQVMSAGTGIYHSEYNKNEDRPVKFLQIWIFPNQENVTPRYGQISLQVADRHNRLQTLVTPKQDGSPLWIHQDAWLHMGEFDANFTTAYTMHKQGQGTYAFVLNGRFRIGDQILATRDGFGIWDTHQFEIASLEAGSQILLIEVPMVH